ncbi:MAG TPA: DUF177 domain-containing protein [Thermoanaerobaculia bacterium]|jgi:uncharacterized metal-binding protein YceD (DUF177 family)
MRDDIIDFDSIDEHGPQSYTGAFDFTPDELDRPELAGSAAVRIEVTADKGDMTGEYVAEGTVGFTADLTCARCVEPYPFANNSPFHVRFRPRPEAVVEGEEIEITDSTELDVEFYSDRAIPLRELAIEQIQLSIPMKPLCDESCLGLCPKCGANRTREACNCDSSIVDERWDSLKGIREALAKKKEV